MANPQTDDGYIRIANDLMDALCKADLDGADFMICLAVIRKTYGWHKKEDQISLSQFEELTLMSRPRILRSIQRLVTRQILGVIKGNSKTSSTYWIIKDYEKWMPGNRPDTSHRLVTGHRRVTGGGNVGDEKAVTGLLHTKYNTKNKLKKDAPVHSKFVDSFKTQYQKVVGSPYQDNKKDYIIAAKLIEKHTLDVVKIKATMLFKLCRDRSVWFTKESGYSSFTIGTLSSKWNEIIENKESNGVELL